MTVSDSSRIIIRLIIRMAFSKAECILVCDLVWVWEVLVSILKVLASILAVIRLVEGRSEDKYEYEIRRLS
jgi:uncharacterized Tic20 family protein